MRLSQVLAFLGLWLSPALVCAARDWTHILNFNGGACSPSKQALIKQEMNEAFNSFVQVVGFDANLDWKNDPLIPEYFGARSEITPAIQKRIKGMLCSLHSV
jgi:hypothetical protein